MSMHALIARALPEYDVRPYAEVDLPALYALEMGNSVYNRLCLGRDITLDEVARETVDMPAGFDPQKKHFLCVWSGEAMIAALDMLDGHPAEGVWFIGLLLVSAGHHRQGIGRRVVRGVAEAARGHAQSLQLGVLECNKAGRAFWTREGFVELRRRDMEMGGVWHTVIVMERAV